MIIFRKILKYVVGVEQGQTYLMGRIYSLTLTDYSSGDRITIKIPYGVDVVLNRPTSHSIFSYWVD